MQGIDVVGLTGIRQATSRPLAALTSHVMERRSLLAVHRRDGEEEGPINAIDATERDREDFSNEKPKVDDGPPTAEEWNRDVDITGDAAAAAEAKEIPKTNNSGDGGTTPGIPVRVTIPPLLLTISPTPDRLTFEQVRTIHDAAERTVEAYFTLLNSDGNDRNKLEDGITFSYLKLLGVTLDEWVGAEGRSFCGVNVQDAKDNSCSGGDKQAKTCVYGSVSEEQICPSGQLCFANIAPSCVDAKDDNDRRRLIRGPARRDDTPSRNLAADAYTVIQLAGGVANFRFVAPAVPPTGKRLGRISEKAIEKGLTKALMDLNDPVLGDIVDITVAPLTSSYAQFLGVPDGSEGGNEIEVIKEEDDDDDEVDGIPKETNEIKDNDVEDANEEILYEIEIPKEEDEDKEEVEDEAEDDEEEVDGVPNETNEIKDSNAEDTNKEIHVNEDESDEEEMQDKDNADKIAVVTEPTVLPPTIMNDNPLIVRDPPTESSGAVFPDIPLRPDEGDEGGSAIIFETSAETAPTNNAPLVTGVVTGMILLAIGLVFSVIVFRRHKHRNKGSIEDETDNFVHFEGHHESDLDASKKSDSNTQGRSKSPPSLQAIKEAEGEVNEEGSEGTDESSSNSPPNQDEPKNLDSRNELSSMVGMRSRSPPKSQELEKEEIHELLDQDMISISETTLSHTDTSLGQGAGIKPAESFEVQRYFESITVRKDMMMPEFTTGTESRDHEPMNAINTLNTHLGRVPKEIDTEDRSNLITYPRHLQPSNH